MILTRPKKSSTQGTPSFSKGISFTGKSSSASMNSRRVTSFMANSSVSNFVNTVHDENEKMVDMKKEIQRERDNLHYGNSLAVKTYQVDNNFLNLKTNLKLLDSTFDIWNFHPKSSVNVDLTEVYFSHL